MGKFNIGVIGSGFMGQLHAKHYCAHVDVNLFGVADTDEHIGRQVAAHHGCKYFEDSREMIEFVDAVSIAVPSSDHWQVAEPFIRSGVHVLIEKPLATTVEDARRLVDLSNEFGVMLLVGHQERFNSAVMAVADRLHAPKFINAQRLGEYVGRAGDVDVITDLMIHDIDLVLTLVDSPVKRVSAVGASVITDHYDVANARIEFDNGAVANVTASRVSKVRVRELEVYDGDQYLTLDLLHQRITATAPPSKKQHEDESFVVEPVTIVSKHTLETEIEHFVDVLSERAAPIVTGEDGLLALRVADMVYKEIAHEQ